MTASAGSIRPGGRQARPGDDDEDDDEEGLGRPDERHRPEHVPSLTARGPRRTGRWTCPRRAPRAGRPGRRPRRRRARRAGRAATASPMPTRTTVRRDALEDEAGDDRDDRGEDADDRRHDGHPADGKPAVQGGHADPAEDAGDERPCDVVGPGNDSPRATARATATARPAPARRGRPRTRRVRRLARPPPKSAAPHDRGGQTQDHRGEPGERPSIRPRPRWPRSPGRPAPGRRRRRRPRWGPGSSTTASAAAS